MALTIYLSPKAQQQAYRAGLPAQAEQTYEVPANLIDQFVSLGGIIDPDGVAVLDAQYIDHLGASEVRRDGKALVFDTRPTDTGHALHLIAEQVNVHREAWEAKEKLTAELANQYIVVASRWLDEHPVEELVEYLRRNEPLPEAPEDKHGRSTEAYRWVQKRIGDARQRLIETVTFSDEQLFAMASGPFNGPTIELGNDTYSVNALWDAQPGLWDRAAKLLTKQKERDSREIIEWLREHTDDDTAVERYQAGLLGKDELSEWLARIELGSLNRFNPFVCPSMDDITCSPDMHGPYDDNDDDDGIEDGVERDHESADKVTSAEWRIYREIRDALPEGATSEVRTHFATCLRCGEIAAKNAAHVTVRRWGVEATRRYSLTSAETDPLVDSSETCDRI